MDDATFIVFCTFSSAEEAENICTHLVNKHLAACCNIFPAVKSIYRWEDKLEKEQETFAIIKTSRKTYQILEKEIKMMHSYSVPEIISVEIKEGSSAYIDWIISSTSGRK